MSMKNGLFVVIDVESVGLHGEGFAVGYVVTSANTVLEEGEFACGPNTASGNAEDHTWILSNVKVTTMTHASPQGVRQAFWEVWMRWKERGALLVCDCGWPVEARFLAACVDDEKKERNWQGPYPMHELATLLASRGLDPLDGRERIPDELPVHNALNDARQAARLLRECLRQ